MLRILQQLLPYLRLPPELPKLSHLSLRGLPPVTSGAELSSGLPLVAPRRLPHLLLWCVLLALGRAWLPPWGCSAPLALGGARPPSWRGCLSSAFAGAGCSLGCTLSNASTGTIATLLICLTQAPVVVFHAWCSLSSWHGVAHLGAEFYAWVFLWVRSSTPGCLYWRSAPRLWCSTIGVGSRILRQVTVLSLTAPPNPGIVYPGLNWHLVFLLT